MADVATVSSAYEAMADRWALVRSLMGGTRSMREAGELYLPRYPGEDWNDYERRRDNAVLTNVYRRTVRSLTGKVFSKPATIGEDMPGQMVEWSENIDLQGSHINVFARNLFRDALQAGLTHILVDFPRARPGMTLADERAAGNRPYFVHLKAEQVIFARRALIGGREILTHLRICEDALEADGEFGEVLVQRIRVFDRTDAGVMWRLFELTDKNEWVVVDEGGLSIPEIPLVTYYLDRTGLMTAEIPLEDLAYLNVLHWQSASDHHNALTYSRFPQIKVLGVQDDKEIDNLVVGPGRLLTLSSSEATLDYLEHTGKAFEAGRMELEDLLEAMDMMALEPLLPKSTGQLTATARALDENQANSALEAWALAEGDALEQAFVFAGMYVNEPRSGSIVMNTDFGLSLDQAKDIEALLKMRAIGDISRETLYAELKRRGVLSDDLDAEEEGERIAAEGPDMVEDEEIAA